MDKLFTAVPRSLVTTLTVLYSFCVFTKPYIFLETATDGSINLLQLSSQTLFSVHFWIYKFPFSENNSNRSGSSSSNKPLPKWCDLNSSLCMLLRAFLSSVVILFYFIGVRRREWIFFNKLDKCFEATCICFLFPEIYIRRLCFNL